MPRKFEDLTKIEGQMEIFAASVPHLLHWDIAYLWMLERAETERPEDWKQRIRAWKHLVALLLLDGLEIREQIVQPPLLQFVAPWGMQAIHWVQPRGDSTPLGVTSPLVLVRPLPDFGPSNRGKWPLDPNDDRGVGVKLRHFVELASRRLRAQGDVPARLAGILRKEFEVSELEGGRGFRSRGENFSFLERIRWLPKAPDTVTVRVEIAARGRRWVPRCQHPQCDQPLTVGPDKGPISVQTRENDFALSCEQHGEQRIPLSKLMLWQRAKDNEVVIWADRRCPGVPVSSTEELFPPDALVEGDMVTFEWDPGEVAGEMGKRFAKVRFENKRLRKVSFDDVRFQRLLVVGPPEEFAGLPVRPEWRDVLVGHHGPEWDPQNECFNYRFRIGGWPFEFHFSAVMLQREPGLVLGIYPDYIPAWKPYRVFVAGQNHRDYRVWKERGVDQRRMPWYLNVQTGWPGIVAVAGSANTGIGCTFDCGERDQAGPEDATDLLLGVDFGTTNTLVYYAGGNDTDLEPRNNAIRPSELKNHCKRLAGGFGSLGAGPDGYFFPTRPPHEACDEFLMPSAFWDADEFAVVRWSEGIPFPSATPLHGFKWDNDVQSFSRERLKYLKEILFLSLPYAYKEKRIYRRKVNLRVGWAFPLAFGIEARRSMALLLDEIRVEIQGWGLAEVQCYSIDESRANVIGRGAFNPGETFLVADMGGGTLDLALSTKLEGSGKPYCHHQIGSIRFAGEGFLSCLIEKIENMSQDKDQFYWRYRDAIEGRPGPNLHGNQIASRQFERFTAVAFEFLRTMYAAHSRDGAQPVHLILVGNGWRLIEAIAEETPMLGPSRVFDDSYRNKGATLALKNFNVYPDLPEPWERKHFVARGALKNAKDQYNELGDQAELTGSKLPAGRQVHFFSSDHSVDVLLEWYELVGGGGKDLGYPGSRLKDINIETKSDVCPPSNAGWQRHWNFACGPLGYAPAERVRDWLRNCLGGDSRHLSEGPLQLLMERWWLKRLGEGI